jgi:transposase InsO family protein
MYKKIPDEQLICLWNSLNKFPKRDYQRKVLIEEYASYYDISVSSVYRQLSKYKYVDKVRSDSGSTRSIHKTNLIRYCKIISALKLKTSNQRNNISTRKCIHILETEGVSLDDEHIKVPKGLLKRSTVDKYLKKFELDYSTIRNVQPVVSRFEATYSNECWQFDFSVSNLKRINEDSKVLYIANIIDDKSGIAFSKYIEADGEDALTALRVLFDAMKSKNNSYQLQGIPSYIYTDNGAFARSKVFQRVLKCLGITLMTHLPKGSDGRRTTARSKGKVERFNRTLKNDLESMYFLNRPKDIDEANIWLENYTSEYNKTKHRSIDIPRIKVWKDSLENNTLSEMCDESQFAKLIRKPETRTVNSDATVTLDGISYQLDGELYNKRVTVLHGVFDKQIYIEYKDQTLGPFHPSGNIISFGDYSKPKKTSIEKQVDEIEAIAESINVSSNIMLQNIDNTKSSFIKKTYSDSEIFSSKIEAKRFISTHIGCPLAEMNNDYILFINNLVMNTLDKSNIIREIDNYVQLKIYSEDNA